MKKLHLSSNEQDKLMELIRKHMNDTAISDFTIDSTFVKSYLNRLAKEEEVEKPVLYITSDAYVSMFEMVRQSPLEISWHGLVQKLSPSEYLIYDTLMFPQINSATATTTDETDFAEWQTNLIMDEEFPIEHLRMHGHSHVNMNVFSSGVDDQYQKDILTMVKDGDFYIFLILNKKMEMCVLLYDMAQHILFETADIEIEILSEVNSRDIRSDVAADIKELCTTKSYRSAKPKPLGKPTVSDLALDEEEEVSWWERYM